MDNENDNLVLQEGSKVVLVRTEINGEAQYSIPELYRLDAIAWFFFASIINTLVLAYVGASFPVFILMAGWPRPLWVNLNSEGIAEEIARTLVGSMTFAHNILSSN